MKGFDATLQRAAEFVALKAKAEKGDAAAKLDFLIARCERDQIPLDEVEKAAVAAGKLPPSAEARMASLRLHCELLGILKGMDRTAGSQQAGAAKTFAMYQAKRIPTGHQDALLFWQLVMLHAQNAGDPDTFEAGIARLRELIGDDPGAQPAFARMEQQLAKLKEAKGKPPETEPK